MSWLRSTPMSEWIVIIEQQPFGGQFAAIRRGTKEQVVQEVEEWAQTSQLVAITAVPAGFTFARLEALDGEEPNTTKEEE